MTEKEKEALIRKVEAERAGIRRKGVREPLKENERVVLTAISNEKVRNRNKKYELLISASAEIKPITRDASFKAAKQPAEKTNSEASERRE